MADCAGGHWPFEDYTFWCFQCPFWNQMNVIRTSTQAAMNIAHQTPVWFVCRRWIAPRTRGTWMTHSVMAAMTVGGHVFPEPKKADDMTMCMAIITCATAMSLMSGTPVITSDRGSMPEVVTDDVGFRCNGIDEMERAIRSVDRVSPAACRARAEKLFTSEAMAHGYVEKYREVLERGRLGAAPAVGKKL